MAEPALEIDATEKEIMHPSALMLIRRITLFFYLDS